MKVYKIYETPFRWGDDQTPEETTFTTPEVRDDYFKKLFKICKEDSHLKERENVTTDKKFIFDGDGKWSYEYTKTDEELKIIESFDFNDGHWTFDYMK